jgi:hypothetical protein
MFDYYKKGFALLHKHWLVFVPYIAYAMLSAFLTGVHAHPLLRSLLGLLESFAFVVYGVSLVRWFELPGKPQYKRLWSLWMESAPALVLPYIFLCALLVAALLSVFVLWMLIAVFCLLVYHQKLPPTFIAPILNWLLILFLLITVTVGFANSMYVLEKKKYLAALKASIRYSFRNILFVLPSLLLPVFIFAHLLVHSAKIWSAIDQPVPLLLYTVALGYFSMGISFAFYLYYKAHPLKKKK